MKYFIYEIPNVKVGCTIDPTKRVTEQGYNEFIILEEHEDVLIASQREIELQKEKNYPVDHIPYWKSIESRSHAGKKGGNKTGLTNAWINDRGKMLAACSKAGRLSDHSKGGVAASVSPNRVQLRIFTCESCGVQIRGISYYLHIKKCKRNNG